MDALSEVLRTVTLNGAVFYNGEFSAPWSFSSPASGLIAPYVAPGGAHVIIYHLLVDGHAWARVENGDRTDLVPGDIIVFPHGDPHFMGNGLPAEPVDLGKDLQRILSEGLKTARMGGGGDVTRLACGYMACDPQLSRLFLAGLPRLLRVNIREDEPGGWLENSIRFSAAHAAASVAGAQAVLAKLSEALFIETLRRYAAALPPGQQGWLAAAADPEVGRALELLHRQPARPWTVAGLASSVGVSRTVLAERFRHCLGEPPIGYLTRFRLHLGARMLSATTEGVARIAAEVGYDSEAAFNRAFKREFGLPPARFRRRPASE